MWEEVGLWEVAAVVAVVVASVVVAETIFDAVGAVGVAGGLLEDQT